MWLPQHTSLSLSPPPAPLAVPPALSMACQKGFYSWRVQTKAAHTPHSLPCSPLPLPRRVAFFRLPGRRAPLGRSCRLGHSTSGIRDPASHTCAGLKVMICFISHGNRWQSFRPHTDMPTPKTDPPTSSSPLPQALRFMFSCKQNNGHASGLGLKESKGERSVSWHPD